MESKNLAALVEYFESGCKKEELLGVELEHFVINKETRKSLAYENGLEIILQRLQPLYGEAIMSEGRIIGITGSNADITLEPAAQMEISIHPSPFITEIRDIYNHFTTTLAPILEEMDCELFCAGYHPVSKAADMPLIPKKRYEYMDEHFKSTGTHGLYMMRGTASAQVNIDYKSEDDFRIKYRIACLLTPVLSFLFDRSKVFEGAPYDKKALRDFIWKNVDPARVLPPKNSLNMSFTDYAKYIYDMPPIFILRENEAVYTGNKPNREIFADKLLTLEDIEHITSMAFPHVRLKNRIELRMADSMPIEQTLMFTALVRDIFYKCASDDFEKSVPSHVIAGLEGILKSAEY
ncbi:MAG: glutamate-cysteine ligase family protein [Defluviitaleaceae bacterium]|nr:glutamate-cysteine ligase family protein [Defluviitaleaceae bacterium]